ncbi:hypothetical protein SBF1_8930002 [Candidatus Desulfosporosinus infrequens]|uniref:Uncharacterized protein n=1 Tax=Candidatus Desulfosporosinus infrequens TaxID=2043169 RepID=A0A2U3LWK3_9FIRM|nr:hypothetical protein SBF1_8930002 [Candidatus Desulfosporosinus infrequens]
MQTIISGIEQTASVTQKHADNDLIGGKRN